MALTKNDLGQISEIVHGAINGAVSGLATKDELQSAVSGLATKDELRTAVSGLVTKDEFHFEISRLATKDELNEGLDSVKGEIQRVRSMLEEDYRAEANRVTRISRRLDRTRLELKQHIAREAHSQG